MDDHYSHLAASANLLEYPTIAYLKQQKIIALVVANSIRVEGIPEDGLVKWY